KGDVRPFEEAQQLASRLVGDFPSQDQLRSKLLRVVNNHAMVEERAGQLNAAHNGYAAASVHRRMAFDLAPQMADFREYLSKHLFNYGRALRSAGKPAQAAEIALERRQLWPEHGRHLYEIALELVTAAEQLSEQSKQKDDLAASARFAQQAKATWK